MAAGSAVHSRTLAEYRFGYAKSRARSRHSARQLVGEATGVARRAEQLEDNAKASGMRLPPEIQERMDEVYPPPG